MSKRKAGDSGLDDPNSSSSKSVKKALPSMMYGFGDNEAPMEESVDLMAALLAEYWKDMVDDAFDIAKIKGRLDAKCFTWLVRQPKDRRKYERIKQLLRANEEIKACRNVSYVKDGKKK